MFCKECGSEISDRAAVCVNCGVSTRTSGGTSRVVYILLGLLLTLFGLPGIHNFYAGYHGRGVLQLCLTYLSCGLLWPAVIIWVIVEVCVTDVDARGNPMSN